MRRTRNPKTQTQRKSPTRLNATSIRERGWTNGLITKFLGEPDQLKKNPFYRDAAPVRLYDLSRVEAAELSPEWITASAQTQHRRAGASKAVRTKTDALLKKVEQLRVEVKVLPLDQVRKLAINNYNRAPRRERDNNLASADDDPLFLDRITVNYIRHSLTTYDEHLHEIERMVGKDDAYRAIRTKVLNAIAAAYPTLADEARNG